MASLVSQVSLVNRSLLSIGGRAQVSSIFPSDGSTQADAAAILFIPTFESLGRAAWWNCLRKQALLTVVAAAQGTPENPSGTVLPLPPSPWLYAYQYPSDCLKARMIVPSYPIQGGPPLTTVSNAAPVWIAGQGEIPFAVAYSTDPAGNPITVVLTNQGQAQMIYTVDQSNPIIWDTQFQAAFVASLAAFLVPALAMDKALMQAHVSIAERIIAEARASDGNEGTTTQDHVPDWIRARSGGYANSTTWGVSGYDNMGW